ncbi:MULTISPECIES: hypothetical protein [Subtercola]|uniref:Uncharacterized protein n=1 Tax=Subtercola vilae TaxID=2056433 RepID=A0A4V4RG58_9MICO|nr:MULTISPECIES: hypothetical protein [Subtercola]MEA9986448.1 hypothetical protein [Subtercola sp. RTI3]TIH40374.1 hypothetical protein D4765_02135 [Subtercola vilae]
MTACTKLAAAADRLASGGFAGRRYLVEFGREGAGIPAGPLWFVAAAAAGRNRMPGRGFSPELDDGTSGQARHFAGIVATTARVGPTATRWVSVRLRRDPGASADGRLTELALEFATLIRSGTLHPHEAGTWITTHLCADS